MIANVEVDTDVVLDVDVDIRYKCEYECECECERECEDKYAPCMVTSVVKIDVTQQLSELVFHFLDHP